MLLAKFEDHRTSGSEEEDFLRFVPYMGMTAFSRRGSYVERICFRCMQTTKVKMSLHICAVWSAPLLFAVR